MNGKNCILVFRNKKINNFEAVEELIGYFASQDIYFDRLSFCDYIDGSEIARSLNELKGKYGQIILVCPRSMEESLKSYTEKLFCGQFDNFCILKTDEERVYILFSDEKGKLTAADVAEELNKCRGEVFGRSYIRTVGAPAADVNEVMSKASKICPECDFNITEKFSDCIIEIVCPQTVYKSKYDEMYRLIVGGLGEYIYALENITLEEQLFRLLRLRRMKISVSESFTGGGVAKRLVSVPGISEVYDEGLNTYSNRAKMHRLGVDELTLRQFGAVSEQTALEMAEGLIRGGGCDVALSTTGIAGPKSDNTNKPVGLLYIGIATAEGAQAFKYELKGSREKITETAINLALFHVYKKFK